METIWGREVAQRSSIAVLGVAETFEETSSGSLYSNGEVID
jgi:hypothetical protein